MGAAWGWACRCSRTASILGPAACLHAYLSGRPPMPDIPEDARARAVLRRDAERTRSRIVTAARKEFGRSGFAGARVGTIARRAGVNPSLIFYYFQNKAGLYRAVSEQRLASYAPPSAGPEPTREEVLDWPVW